MSVLIFACINDVISDHFCKRFLPLPTSLKTRPLRSQLRRQNLHASSCRIPILELSAFETFSTRYQRKVRTSMAVLSVYRLRMIVPRAVRFSPGPTPIVSEGVTRFGFWELVLPNLYSSESLMWAMADVGCRPTKGDLETSLSFSRASILNDAFNRSFFSKMSE